MLECAKAHLGQSTISNLFRGGLPETPFCGGGRKGRNGGRGIKGAGRQRVGGRGGKTKGQEREVKDGEGGAPQTKIYHCTTGFAGRLKTQNQKTKVGNARLEN